METKTITACDSCTTGIANDDWTHLDAQCCCKPGDEHSEDCEAERAHNSIMATLDHLGWLTLGEPANEPGYFDCAICNEIQCGDGHTFHTNEAT